MVSIRKCYTILRGEQFTAHCSTQVTIAKTLFHFRSNKPPAWFTWRPYSSTEPFPLTFPYPTTHLPTMSYSYRNQYASLTDKDEHTDLEDVSIQVLDDGWRMPPLETPPCRIQPLFRTALHSIPQQRLYKHSQDHKRP
jgi:hypothetical protein